MRDENGLEKCVACGLCAVACPADAIYLEAAENDGTVQAGPRYAQRLPDPQDALHLLRLLRRGLPGVGDLHGQGLRARRLQQQGLHLGQGGPAGAGAGHDRDGDDAGPRHPVMFGALGDIHGDFDAARRIVARHPEVPFWLCVGDVADDAGRYEPLGAPRLLDQRQQRQLRRDRRRRSAGAISITFQWTASNRRPEGRPPTVGGLWRTSPDLGAARSRPTTWYETPAGRSLPHPTEGDREGDRTGRQAPPFRPRGGRGVQGAARRRRLPDPRGGEAVPGVPRRARDPMPGRRRSTRCWRRCGRGCTCSGTITASPSEVREGVRSVGLDLVTRSYLLIDAATLDYSSIAADTLKSRDRHAQPRFSRSSTAACSSATARWGRCCTRGACS